MEPIILYIIIGAAALILGLILGKLVFAKNTKNQIAEAEQQAKKIIADGQLQAETLKKEKLLEAKEKFVQLKADHDRDVMQRNSNCNRNPNFCIMESSNECSHTFWEIVYSNSKG